VTPNPTNPDYADRCIANVLKVLGQPSRSNEAPLSDLTQAISGSAGVVLVVLDGLGASQLANRSALAPLLAARQIEPITSVAPSTTAAALTSLTTGRPPGAHGIVGYRFSLGEDILQSLRWTVDSNDATRQHPPEQVQRSTPLLMRKGRAVPYVGRKAFATSTFTKAHLRGSKYLSVEGPDEMPAVVAEALRSDDLVICYHDAIDKIAHAEGLGAGFDDAVRRADRLLAEIRGAVPDDVTIVVTSDHGQVDCGPTAIEIPKHLLALVDFMSGEGRFRWLHAHRGQATDLVERMRGVLDATCWVKSRREVIAAGWLGEVDDEVVDRLGDVAILPFIDAFVPDPAEPLEVRMKSRHGSLTEAEMMVPLIVL